MTAGVYLAFDYGTKRIGVAIGDAVTRAARPLRAIGPDWREVERLLAEWTPAACVVGLPLGRDAGEQPITRLARGFAAELQKRFAGPVHLCDERYSSREAQGVLREARGSGVLRRRVREGDEDSAAARVILEQWLKEGARGSGLGVGEKTETSKEQT